MEHYLPGMSTPTITIPPAATAGRIALIREALQPGDEPPLHLHNHEDELIILVAGQIQVRLGGGSYLLSPGAALLLPRGAEHTYGVIGACAELLTLYSPAGFAGFYQERAGAPPWAAVGPRAVERLVAAAARYGCTITGPNPWTGPRA